MWAFALATLVSGAPVFLEVQESRGVSAEDSAELARLVGVVLESKTGMSIAPDERSAQGERLVLRALGVPTRVRLLAERSSPTQPTRTHEIDLPRARATWPDLVEGLVLHLYTPVAKPPEPVVTPPPASTPARTIPNVVVRPSSTSSRAFDPRVETAGRDPTLWPSWGPVITAGTGVVAAGVGLGFGLSSRAARREARNMPVSDAEFEALEDRAIHHGTAANVLFGVALAGVVGGTIWYLLE